jgi:PKD repeat protein
MSAGTNVSGHTWSFGDGGIGTGDTVSHIYTNSGRYDVRLIVKDANNCIDTILKPLYIRVDGPVANFGVASSTTCLITTVPIIDSSLTDGLHPITSWVWNYGDGIIQSMNTGPFQHTYSSAGKYSINLKITDTQGCSDSIMRPGVITISQPVANFLSDTVNCPGILIPFTNLSTGSGLTYSWDFGDGNTSNIASPSHSYLNDGLYTVKLSITDSLGCTSLKIRINYIRITTPYANFLVSDTVGTCPPLVVNFTNTSTNYTSFIWDFGDSTSSQTLNPSHFYSTPGVYDASLTVKGPTGCISVKTHKIVVRGPEGSFTYTPLTGCDSLTVQFVGSTKNRESFIWDTGNNGFNNLTYLHNQRCLFT